MTTLTFSSPDARSIWAPGGKARPECNAVLLELDRMKVVDAAAFGKQWAFGSQGSPLDAVVAEGLVESINTAGGDAYRLTSSGNAAVATLKAGA